MTEKQLSGKIDHFFSFIQAGGDGLDQARSDVMAFFSQDRGTHVVHDQGALYFYRDKKLLFCSDKEVSDSPMIHTFDGKKITQVSPWTEPKDPSQRGYLMKSGGKGRGRRGYDIDTDSDDVSSNNNNNNNNNNNG